MSSDEHDVPASPILDFEGVRQARRRQAEEDRQELERLDPLDLLKELQTRLDIIRLRSGRASSDLLREFLFEAPQWRQPSERERSQAIVRVARRWAGRWKFHEDRVQRAVKILAAEQDLKPSEKKEEALRVGILEALAEAREPQITRIGRDRVRSLGSWIRLYQKQDLEKFAREGLTDELEERLDRPPAGIHVFPPYRLLSPIEAAFLGGNLEMIRPVELRPRLLIRWVRTRAMRLAQDRLLDEAELDHSAPHPEWRRVEVADPERKSLVAPRDVTDGIRELELLAALDREEVDCLRELIRREDLAALYEVATPAQQQILELLRRRLVLGLSFTEAKKAVAQELDTTVNRIDVALTRLRQRARDRL